MIFNLISTFLSINIIFTLQDEHDNCNITVIYSIQLHIKSINYTTLLFRFVHIKFAESFTTAIMLGARSNTAHFKNIRIKKDKLLIKQQFFLKFRQKPPQTKDIFFTKPAKISLKTNKTLRFCINWEIVKTK